MKNEILVLTLLIFAFSITALGQEPVKFDEFGKLYCDDLLARLDPFAMEINNSAGKSFGFVVVYEGKYGSNEYDNNSNPTILPMVGEAQMMGETIREYVVDSRGIPKNQLMIISGGFREEHVVELWLVSRSGTIPDITPTLDNINYRKGKPVGVCDGF
ncbi:MAG: hypothetical protein R2681_16185 [Pyrinomonadaceae bacterium]